ncbi:MAG: hypothetical protein ABIH03_04315, partial [Pseudomonadota bacterium]
MAVRFSKRNQAPPQTGQERRLELLERRAQLAEQSEQAKAKRKAAETAASRKHETVAQTSAQRAALSREYVRGGRKPPAIAPEGGVDKHQEFVQQRAVRQQTLGKLRAAQAQEEGTAREKRRTEGKGRIFRPTIQTQRNVPGVTFAIPEFGAEPTADTLAQAARLREQAQQAGQQFDIRTGRQALERATRVGLQAADVTKDITGPNAERRKQLATPEIPAEGMANIRRLLQARVAQQPA